MRSIVLISLVSICMLSCKKEKDVSQKIDFNGHWLMMSDSTRFIDVRKINDSTAEITFPRKIDTPPQLQGAITISYSIRESNDTTFCLSRNIYPGCFFIENNSSVKGFITEWMQGPDIGKMKQIIRH